MSLLYHSGLPKSRGTNRQNKIGASVNHKNDIISHNYNNYYGAPSVNKDPKPTSTNQPTYLGYLASNPKDSKLLPKISPSTDKK